MAEIKWQVQIVSGPNKKQAVQITAGVPDGTFSMTTSLDPTGAISLGDVLTKAGTQAKTGLVMPNGAPVQPS